MTGFDSLRRLQGVLDGQLCQRREKLGRIWKQVNSWTGISGSPHPIVWFWGWSLLLAIGGDTLVDGWFGQFIASLGILAVVTVSGCFVGVLLNAGRWERKTATQEPMQAVQVNRFRFH